MILIPILGQLLYHYLILPIIFTKTGLVFATYKIHPPNTPLLSFLCCNFVSSRHNLT